MLSAILLCGSVHAGEKAAAAPPPAPAPAKKPATPAPPPIIEFGNGLRTAQWDAYGYALGKPPGSADFNLAFTLKPKPGVNEPFARAIFNVVDKDNYYFAEFGAALVRLGRVESGVEQPIGTQGSFGLASGASLQAIVKRRAFGVTVVLDGQVAAQAFDDTFSGGQVGLGTKQASVGVEKVRVQRVSGLYFADDFMRGTEDSGQWEPVSGNWRVYALDNPMRSVNAFSYVSRGASGPAAAIAGYRFWDNYRFRVSARATADGSLGIHFCYIDADNHYRFTWPSMGTPAAARKMRLVRRHKGKDTVLAERATRGYRPQQWYALEVHALDGQVQALIDGVSVFAVRDPFAYGGQIGLLAETRGEAFFDDVTVEQMRSFHDDFSIPSRGTWLPLGGNWRVDSAGYAGLAPKGSGVLRVNSSPAARAIAGSVSWQNYRYEADLAPWKTGAVGLIFGYLDETRYGLLRLTAGPSPTAELTLVADGKESVLAKTAAPGLGAKKLRAAVSVREGMVTASADAKPLLQALAPSLYDGQVGVFAKGTPAAFDNAFVELRAERREPVFTVNQIFAAETPMANWAAAQSDWRTVKEQIANEERELSWHRLAFPRDMDIQITLDQAATDKGQLCLFLCSVEEKAATGYELTVTPSGGWAVELRRMGAKVASGQVPKGTPLGFVRARREGAHVLAYLGEVPVIAWKDPQPLTGEKLGWWAKGLALRNESIDVFCDDVLVDNFTTAATEWRVGQGVWDVTQRWQCDPRWSFFSGMHDEGAAVLWHKRRFPGALTMEFCAAVKMDYTKGSGYSYASDLNAVVGADGQNVNSGYSFIFGGWKNTKTAILRQNEIVAETDKLRIAGGIHRWWWHFKIEKRGGKLRYYVDNKLALEYVDPKPLAGDRVGLWTYRNGMMLARFRVACASDTPFESPETNVMPACKCPYDAAAKAK